MTQLIINNVEYPETSHDKYKCYPEDKGENLRMISGRLVTEVSYTVMVLEYSYDYFDEELMRQCLADLRSNTDLTVEYLAPDSDELVLGIFRCVKKPTPSFAFSDDGTPYWHGISFRLEGVDGIA